jgi:oxepin-CoA hydrolase / 3-oxo-5,6-dehydrosuberyl-CoA semialdehyde dehydrogenase
MQSITKLEAYFENGIQTILAQVNADTQPLWGTMNATQMLDHLSDALKLSMGEFAIPESTINEKWEKYKAITLTSDRPIPKGFDNPILKLLQKTNELQLSKAHQNLAHNFTRFKETFMQNGAQFKTPHNMFGYLTYHEWLWFHYKHFSHHFAQFNLIPYIERFELE